MRLPCCASAPVILMAALAGPCWAQEWTEAAVVQTFLNQSPQVREVRALAAVVQAETQGRLRYPNPSVYLSLEGAGRTDFLQVEQTLPVTGRLQIVRQAGVAQVEAAGADGAFLLWEARSALRLAFYRALAAQRKEAIHVEARKEIESVVRVLADRERHGEGSRLDRLRAEQELAELLVEQSLAAEDAIRGRSRILAYLPPGTSMTALAGGIETPAQPLAVSELTRRALAAREDYRAAQRRLEQHRLEQRAAERLRFPEPVVSAGWKRADTGPLGTANGAVFSVTVPLPLFNRGQAEVARHKAEFELVSARLELLGQQIRAAVEAAVQIFDSRQQLRDRYRAEILQAGGDLVRIATLAYQEGEVGILQLLDAYRTQSRNELRMQEIHAAVKEAQIELERLVGEEFPE